jgi:hypothetical protein
VIRARTSPPATRPALAAIVLAALAMGGCSNDSRDQGADRGATSTEGRQADKSARHRSGRPPLQESRCPAGLANCRTASGRIIYVERVDPDGDGDAHFVLASRQSITAPGITVIDVKQSLRPSPLPGRGDRLSAAGPVYQGSYGQRQIEATELYVARSR